MFVWKSSIDCENRCSLLNVVSLAADWACQNDGNQSNQSEPNDCDKNKNVPVRISTEPKALNDVTNQKLLQTSQDGMLLF